MSTSEEILELVRRISDRNIESDDEEVDDGEAEVVALARRCLELLSKGGRQTLVEG